MSASYFLGSNGKIAPELVDVAASGGLTNPLTSDILADNTYGLLNASKVNGFVIETEEVKLLPGSLNPAITFSDNIEFAATKEISFVGEAKINGVTEIRLDAPAYKMVAVPAAAIAYSTVLGYNTVTNEIEYQPAGGGALVIPPNLEVSSILTSTITGVSSMFQAGSFSSLAASSILTSTITGVSSIFQAGSFSNLDASSINTSTITGLSSFFDYGSFDVLEASTIKANTFFTISTIDVINYISSVNVDAKEMTTSTIFGETANFSTINTSTLSGETAYFSTISSQQSYALNSYANFGKFSTLQVSSMGGFSPINVLSSLVLNSNNISNVADVQTSSITLGSITGAGDVVFDAVGSLVLNGKTLNMTGGEIHNIPLIHSQNNSNIVIEGKGNGNVVLSSFSTVVKNTLWVGSNITAPNGFFSTLNTSSLNGYTIPQLIQDSVYTITNSNPVNLPSSFSTYSNVWLNTSNGDLFGFQPPFDEPQERSLPTYAGTTRVATDEASFNAAVAASIAGDIINVTANITFTSAKTIGVGIKLTSDTGSRVLTFSSAASIITFSGDGVLVEGIALTNPNTGGSATCLSFSSQTASNNYVKSCILSTNEFAITHQNTQIQITDNTFLWTGTQDSHRYIALYKNTGITFVARNTFQGNGASPNTACVLIGALPIISVWTNGVFVFKNNTSSTAVQRLSICEVAFGASDNIKFYIHDNTIQSSSGFVIFFNGTPLRGIQNVVAYNNIETLGGTATGSKGILALDNTTLFTLPTNTSAPFITSFSNIVPALRSDYASWSFDRGIAFNNNSTIVGANTPKLYSPALQTEYILNSNALTTSSLTAGSVLANTGRFSTLQVSTMSGFSPITFLSSVRMNNNDITGVSTLSTVNANVANLVVSSINGATPGGGGSIPMNLNVSSFTTSSIITSTIVFETLGGVVGNVNVLGSGNVPVFSFDTTGRTLTTSNTSGDLSIISPTSISVSDGLVQTQITPTNVSMESLTLINPNSNITSQVLYYNTGTSEVSYGDAGVATVPANLSISSLNAVSTLAVSSFTSSLTSFFVSTNQLRANDGTFQGGILASGTIAGNNITANGIAPAGIVSGANFQAQNSMSNISTFGRVANFSTIQVSTINGVVPTFGGGGSAPALASYLGTQQLNLPYNAWANVLWNTTPAFTSGAIGLTVDGAGIFTYLGSGNATYEIMYNVPFDTLTAQAALYGVRCSTLAGVPSPPTTVYNNITRPSAGSIGQTVVGTFYLNLTAVNQQFRFQVYGNEPSSGQPGFCINRNGGTGAIQIIKII